MLPSNRGWIYYLLLTPLKPAQAQPFHTESTTIYTVGCPRCPSCVFSVSPTSLCFKAFQLFPRETSIYIFGGCRWYIIFAFQLVKLANHVPKEGKKRSSRWSNNESNGSSWTLTHVSTPNQTASSSSSSSSSSKRKGGIEDWVTLASYNQITRFHGSRKKQTNN